MTTRVARFLLGAHSHESKRNEIISRLVVDIQSHNRVVISGARPIQLESSIKTAQGTVCTVGFTAFAGIMFSVGSPILGLSFCSLGLFAVLGGLRHTVEFTPDAKIESWRRQHNIFSNKVIPIPCLDDLNKISESIEYDDYLYTALLDRLIKEE